MTRNTSSGSENLPRDCKGLVPWLRNGFTGYTPFASGRKSKKLGVAGSTKYGVTFTLSLLLMPRFVSECTTFRFALSWIFDPARWVPTRWVTENRVGPDAPRLVVISTTPFAADEP